MVRFCERVPLSRSTLGVGAGAGVGLGLDFLVARAAGFLGCERALDRCGAFLSRSRRAMGSGATADAGTGGPPGGVGSPASGGSIVWAAGTGGGVGCAAAGAGLETAAAGATGGRGAATG